MWAYLLLYFVPVQGQEKCYGLAFEGGGAHGAYESGVLYGITNRVDLELIRWDYIHGISTGAINTACCSQYSKGKEKEMAQFAVDSLRSITGNADVWQFWNANPINWILDQFGMVDNSPLRTLLDNKLFTTIQRPVSVGATNIADGSYTIFNQSLSIDDFKEAVVCSSAIPGLFPHQNVFGGVFADGSILHDIDIGAIVNSCIEDGKQYKDIVIDLIFDDYIGKYSPDLDNLNTVQVLQTVQNLQSIDASLRFLTDAQEAYPQVEFRFIAMPSVELPLIFDFRPESLEKSIQIGISDAEQIVKDFQDGKGPRWEDYQEAHKLRNMIIKAD